MTGYFHGGPKKYWWREHFPIHEIGRIDGGRGFQTRGNMLRIGGNTFYDQKNKIPMQIPEFKRTGIGLIAEFRGITNGFPNQGPFVGTPIFFLLFLAGEGEGQMLSSLSLFCLSLFYSLIDPSMGSH
jgi:hypothetical protein